MAGIRFDGFAMKVILWIVNLADFVSHGLMTSQNGYRHTYRLLTVVTFRTQRVPSSPSSTVFSIIPCYSFPVFRGIVTVSAVSAVSRTVLLVRSRAIASHACFLFCLFR